MCYNNMQIVDSMMGVYIDLIVVKYVEMYIC